MDADQIILEQYVKNHPQRAVFALKELKDEDMVAFLTNGSSDLTIRIISSMSTYRAARYLEKLDLELALTVIGSVDLRMKRSLLRQCSEGFQHQLLSKMEPKQAAVLRRKLAFTPGTTGFLMNPLLLVFKNDLSVEEAIVIVKNEKEHISSSIVVVDEKGKPEGVIKLHDLLFAERSSRVSSLMKTEFPKFYADESVESIKNSPWWYEYQSIPVTDRAEILIGALDFKATGKSKLSKEEQNTGVLETSNALGELYRIGLTGLLQSVSE